MKCELQAARKELQSVKELQGGLLELERQNLVLKEEVKQIQRQCEATLCKLNDAVSEAVQAKAQRDHEKVSHKRYVIKPQQSHVQSFRAEAESNYQSIVASMATIRKEAGLLKEPNNVN